ncbi:MAG TPA: threonine/serine dehydratase [Steroidobacteraceae bacterium]
MSIGSLDFEDVQAAARRLAGHARVTPLLHATHLSELKGATVLVKAENLQVGGAFKFRGAYNRLSQLSDEERARGVVAWSSGNHAQGVAAAGQRLGVRTTIVMPHDAPRMKVDNTRRFGGEVVFYDRYNESREEIGRRICEERGATAVPPFDDPHIIAGQGTVGLEIAGQAKALGYELDALIVPASGGGLLAGCALAMSGVSPRTKVYSVEPQGFDDLARSLASGQRESNSPGGRTLCDALMAPSPGEITFPIHKRLVSGGFAVSDAQVLAAIAYAWRELKLVLEPGGAVTLAAVLHDVFDCKGRTVALVLSGGNVDASVFRDALATES